MNETPDNITPLPAKPGQPPVAHPFPKNEVYCVKAANGDTLFVGATRMEHYEGFFDFYKGDNLVYSLADCEVFEVGATDSEGKFAAVDKAEVAE